MSRFDKYLDDYDFDKKLNARIYRLLGKCEKSIFSNIGDLELKIPYSEKKKNEKLYRIKNERVNKEKNEKLYRSLLYKEKLINSLMKNKCTIFHGSYNHYEKKIMNGLNDKAFFKKMMLINDKDYKKLKRKKYRLRLCLLLLLFILVLILPIVDLSFGEFKTTGNFLNELCSILGYKNGASAKPAAPREGLNAILSSTCELKNFIGIKVFVILMYCLPILILGIILIRGIFYYYKNVIKYKKLKFLEEFNEW
ncbi:Plasmodium exported protein (Pm-fam-a like), unknown function [Plasmodium malariae]|uniref:Fam-l protein n=1 Tax=Plasmodium malariae TaxID=5858 RepID=A0A1A8X4X9_PLAMA|nr:Plasmodium exported protein (Pm-fam-a like), unknown function [Plasmodium malariae]